MLDAAALRPGETVYDLGCGDGRVLVTAVQKFKAKAVGVEISPKLAQTARDNIKRAGLENHIQVIEGNMMDVDISPADVVILYLLTQSNDLLRPKLEKSLHPGARVVSHDFKVPGWEPRSIDRTEVYNRMHVIYVYQMPPQR